MQPGDRDAARPADSAGAGAAGDGGGGSCNGGGSGSARSGEGEGEGEGEDEGAREGLFPSSRPLRVFVSQGDIVYVDEVEAVAIRGGDAAEPSTAEDPAAHGHTYGEKGEEVHGKSAGKSGGGEGETAQQQQQSHSANGGERMSPSFFDPLLNPGSSGGQDQDGGAWSSAVLLLVPLRLGLDELSAGYIPSELRSKTVRVGAILWACFMDMEDAGPQARGWTTCGC